MYSKKESITCSCGCQTHIKKTRLPNTTIKKKSILPKKLKSIQYLNVSYCIEFD